MVIILQVININEELKKEIINFLSNISSVTEIDEDIISSGVALLDDNQVKGLYYIRENFVSMD